MNWIQIKLEVTQAQQEIFESLLLDAGALAVTMEDAGDQPVFEPLPGEIAVWENLRLTGLFEANTPSNTLISQLQANYQASDKTPFPPYKVEILEDKDWIREWMDQYQPIQFGNRLWVCPSWCKPVSADAINLILDPGLAFGTGTHATTQLCLEWLDATALNNLDIIDYGCGSGILGIAALLLGARSVLGIDLDPQALTASKANAERNNINPDQFEVSLPKDRYPFSADILIANILAQPLIDLAPAIAPLIKPGGHLVLSGVLLEQHKEVADAYAPWFDIAEPTVLSDWIRLHGIKRF